MCFWRQWITMHAVHFQFEVKRWRRLWSHQKNSDLNYKDNNWFQILRMNNESVPGLKLFTLKIRDFPIIKLLGLVLNYWPVSKVLNASERFRAFSFTLSSDPSLSCFPSLSFYVLSLSLNPQFTTPKFNKAYQSQKD